MYENDLIQTGLTQNEAKVYLSLLKLGKAASGKIVQEAKISSGKIYETLQKLLNKGLIELIIENGVKHFQATNPDSLLLYMKEKEQQIITQTQHLEKIIPELKQIKHWEAIPENVFLIKGIRGIKPLVYDALTQSKYPIKVMGVRSSKNKIYNTFWLHWHNERISQHKQAQALFTDRNTSYWQEFKKMKLTETKCLTSLSPSAIMIIDTWCFIFSYEEEFTCIAIQSPSITKSFTSFFDSLWLIAKS